MAIRVAESGVPMIVTDANGNPTAVANLPFDENDPRAREWISRLDAQTREYMQAELLKARIVSREEFPGDAVALNSMVKIKDDLRGRVMDLVLVTPDKADISKNHISVLAPIGIALIGYRKGDKINWKMPSGNRSFTIMEVKNPD